MVDVPKIKLSSGTQMPILGLGTWKSEPNKVGEAVKFAIKDAGYIHIDCAAIYGNEKEIGNVFSTVIPDVVARENLFVTSKLWNTEHKAENVEVACKKTLEDLQLEYLDMYLIHWGVPFEHGADKEPKNSDGIVKTEKVSIRETWEAMENLVKKGYVKSIGVSNFTVTMILDMLSYASIKPAVNQVELHPYNSQSGLVEYCKKNEIQLTAYSPLGSANHANGEPNLLEDAAIKEIATETSRTPAQVLIRWAIQRETVVIPKSTNPDRIAQNVRVFDFELNGIQMERINRLNKNFRYVNPVNFWGIPYFE